MDRSQQLAGFLRARRERVKPDDVGIRHGDRRRVPGLRREELAMRAGLSVDYYMRLEQGRDHRPSEQTLAALARALELDDDAIAHLYGLARPAPPIAQPAPADIASVPTELQDLLDSWTTTPALIHGRRLDVVASNALGRALTPLAEPGANMLRSMFLDAEVRERYADPEFVSAGCVAYFRATVGSDLDDPILKDLVGELSLKSEEFRQLWARHDVQQGLAGEQMFLHPVVGPMRLRYQTFAVWGTEGHTLLAVHAPPSSRDARALARLATLTNDPGTEPRAGAAAPGD